VPIARAVGLVPSTPAKKVVSLLIDGYFCSVDEIRETETEGGVLLLNARGFLFGPAAAATEPNRLACQRHSSCHFGPAQFAS
jgi:hypothetical protein